jgi:hypothetical protein
MTIHPLGMTKTLIWDLEIHARIPFVLSALGGGEIEETFLFDSIIKEKRSFTSEKWINSPSYQDASF